MGTTDDERNDADDTAVGRSGARFPSAKQRKRFRDVEPEPSENDESERNTTDSRGRKSRVGRSGARFPSAKLLDKLADDEPEELPEPEPAEPAERTERVFAEAEQPEELEQFDPLEQHRLRVRPYVLTRGRTQARQDLAVETLISTDPQAPWNSEQLSSEYQAVRRLCMQPRSVAEVAALLAVPLGVARVLLSDLAEAGLVHVHTTTASYAGRPDYVLMQRVLEGLHRL
ncbi:DUF742 domain-containing protein [Saccharomonospora sp. NPDC046836]|uniref:DUF742 domain-containing protein n=1 Tax=Saccharomonospora sp. NPDC046836 TaxID=3156921 RepID=UPI0033DEC021